MNTGLEGRVALVCGAPAGIGYAIARALARDGVALPVNCGRSHWLLECCGAGIRRL